MLSVVVLTYNDPLRLRLCLFSLLAQTETDYELIVVNDGGDRKINGPVYEELYRQGMEIKEIWLGPETSEFRAAAARNTGLKLIHGERVLFVDGDCILAANVIAEHALYRGSKVLVNGTRKRIPEKCLQWLQPEHFERLDQYEINRDARYEMSRGVHYATWLRLKNGETTVPLPYSQVSSFQLSVPVFFAKQIGGFNEEFIGYGGEDEEFAARINQTGVELLGRFDLVSYHLEHPTRKPFGYTWRHRVIESVERPDPVRNGGPLREQ